MLDTLSLFSSIEKTKLHDGAQLTAIVGAVSVVATSYAFALWCVGGDQVVTWGHPCYGGDNREVLDQLRRVERVFASDSAFAAILSDGRVVTWGNPDCGGNSDSVQAELIDVQTGAEHLRCFCCHFRQWTSCGHGAILHAAAKKPYDDQPKKSEGYFSPQTTPSLPFVRIGTVLTWGDERCGGDSSEVQDQLRQVCQIRGAAGGAFAAILENGGVVTWGDSQFGADSSGVSRSTPNM